MRFWFEKSFDLKIFDLGSKCKSQAQIFAESME